ncbi:hypothetical protein [Flavobacterium sp. LB1P62]|uniref:hypothetical protein n=1 Tax=Flavobacterium sp. LB1P62 TaxID=3401715 RepID=UPI003AAF9170
MKTLEKLKFPKLENDYLENILRQLVRQYNVIQMFFTRQQYSEFSCLIINIESNIDAQKLQQSKWVRKVKEHLQINIAFIFSSKLRHHYSLGSPFLAFYCRESAVIYQNNEFENSIFRTEEWQKFKKRFNEYENNFYHDHDLHAWQIKNLISEGSSNSVFISYARLVGYDLDYLEELYLGSKFALVSLDERINNLIQYIPDIQKYFVRNNRNKFYLTDLFTKAKEASAEDDVIYKEEMYEAVGIAQRSLYCLIEKRLAELKKLIKKGLHESSEAVYEIEKKPGNKIINTAIKTILEMSEVEQIYLYHQIVYGEKATYYLLIIGNGIGNEKLISIIQSLKSKIVGKYDFVLISHNRNWIQKSLYQCQSFFSNIIQDKYLIYSSSQYHPEFHWEVPHNPYHADLYFYYKSAKDSAMQFCAVANNTEENYCGLDALFTLFFLSFCRTYIFVKTFYLTHYLSSQALWELCIYADADIRKYNYLTEQFWTDFFPYLDKHRNLYHKLSILNKKEVDQMNVIVEKLMYELHDLVIEGGLLLKSEHD